MHFLLYTAIDLLSVALILAPVFLLRNQWKARSPRYTFFCLLLSLYISVLWMVTGLPNVLYHPFEFSVYLLPIIGMADDIRNSILNCILFLPLGFLLPLIWQKYRQWGVTVLFGFFLSLAIEVMQIFTYRLTDVNDLITNTLGTGLGFLLAKPFLPKVNGSDQSQALQVLADTGCAIFFLHPLVSGLLWKLIA